jgi:hypothetical protein
MGGGAHQCDGKQVGHALAPNGSLWADAIDQIAGIFHFHSPLLLPKFSSQKSAFWL